MDAGSVFVAIAVTAGVGIALGAGAPPALRAAFVGVAVLVVAGLVEFYDRWSWFDTVLHVAGGFVAGPLAVVLAERAGIVSLAPRGAALVLCLAAGAAIGAGWEMAEWAVDGIFGSALQENLDDSMRDLLADTVAAGAGVVLLRGVRHAPARGA